MNMKTKKQKQQGMTLIELMVGIAIMTILITIAVPSYKNSIERGRVKSLAEAIYTDLQLARSESIKGKQTPNGGFTFSVDVANQCYGMVNGTAACECSTANDCMFNGLDRAVDATSFPGVIIASTTLAGNSTTFDSIRGTANSGCITVESSENASMQLRVGVNALGRTNICIPDGAYSMPGYDGCGTCPN